MGATGSKKDSKQEPDFTIPSGLYHTLNWDLKVVKRMILNKRLAPLYPGQEEPGSEDFEECPICFLFYPGGLNRSICCKKGICTECFLQIKKPNGQSFCPFCQIGSYSAIFGGPLSKEEKEKEAWEQQQVNDARLRMRNEEIEQDFQREKLRRERSLTASSMGYDNQTSPSSASPPPESGFPISQSLILPSPGKELSELSSSYLSTKRGTELDDIMLQETVRLFLMNRENGSDTETLSDKYSEEQEDTLSDTNQEDLELALALALSLQNVIK